MVVKGIIEEKITSYKFRVRIPIFDRSNNATLKTPTRDLAIATASLPKGVYNNLDIGDVVFIAFENNDLGLPVIIGQLYRESLTKDDQNPLLNCRTINVSDQALLPTNTIIGNIPYEKIFYLDNVKSDIQLQLDNINKRLNNLGV